MQDKVPDDLVERWIDGRPDGLGPEGESGPEPTEPQEPDGAGAPQDLTPYEPGTVIIKVKPGLDSTVMKLHEEGTKLLSYATRFQIQSPDDVKRATNDLVALKDLRQRITTTRKEWLDPINQAHSQVNDAFKLIAGPVDQADEVLRGKVLKYNQEQQELERQRKEAEELRRRAAELESGITQETGELFDEPTPLPSTLPTPQPAKKAYAEMGSLNTRKDRVWELVDFSKVPDDYKMLDTTKIGKVVRAGGTIEGIRVFEKDTLTVHSKKGA